MTDANVIMNAPIEVEIGDRKLLVRRLTISGVFAALEAGVLSKKMAEMHMVAAGLEGTEKIQFLKACTMDLPQGEVLQAQVVEHIATIDGVKLLLLEATKADQPDLTLDDLSDVVTVDTMDELGVLMEHLCDFGDDASPKKKRKATKKKPASAKKKKATRKRSRS